MKMRAQLGIKEDEIALIYLGKFGGMYWDEELFTLFRACYRRAPELYHFIILSQDDLLKLREKLRAAGIPDERAHLAFVPLNQVPAYLAASDMGICAVRQFPSKRYCSPIKDGEYWANGLPVAIPTGVSDDYELTRENGLGVVIEETSTLGLELAAEDIHKWFQQHQASEVRARTRDFAARDRDVKVFRGVLNELFVELIS